MNQLRIVGVLNHFIVVYPQLLELFITTCLLQNPDTLPFPYDN
jgi:hypothetical protein